MLVYQRVHFSNFLQPPLNQESSTIYGIYESGFDVIPLPMANQFSSGITNSRTGKMRGSICRYPIDGYGSELGMHICENGIMNLSLYKTLCNLKYRTDNQ